MASPICPAPREQTIDPDEENLSAWKCCSRRSSGRSRSVSDRLQRDSNAVAVLVINKDGQEIARSGQTKDLDVTSLSSLFAGNVAATSEIAKLPPEEEFPGQFHEGTKQNVHSVGGGAAGHPGGALRLPPSLGLVRLRVRRGLGGDVEDSSSS